MRKALLTLVLALAAATATTATAASDVQLTPVGRLPFPDRGYLVDLPPGTAVAPGAVVVRENGLRVRDLAVTPVQASGIHYGVVLAIDASDSMRGAPLDSAMAAARAFLSHRETDEEVGIVAFNGRVRALQAPTSDPAQLGRALARQPQVAFGTRIYDALARSLVMLDRAKLSTGSIVLLSDGADLGSRADVRRVLARAKAQHVRVFTVGLRSSAFDAQTLQRVAQQTGGGYTDAPTAERLRSIYAELSRRLAGEYLVRYRSDARPHSQVRVDVEIGGVGGGKTQYTAPTPSGLAPFHRSFFSRLLLSGGASFLLSLFIAALAAVVIIAFVRPRGRALVDRIDDFAGGGAPGADARRGERRLQAQLSRRLRAGEGWLARFQEELEVARIEMPATRILLLTVAGTIAAMFLLGLISPVFAILGLLTPVVTRSYVSARLHKVQNDFADQLAPNLQVLASALRVGHSFSGALAVVVENAHEPSRSELQRVVTDERLGVPLEESIRRVSERMASRDLDQVALLAELQRTAGGNAAEVLDTVVETLRERADLRRLMRTLTAQGRLARWILTALPVVVGLGMWLLQEDAMKPLLNTNTGQILLVAATIMVVSGSLVIQRIVEIKV
ncbi:MAG TPA: VWA domain-containing protein [Gaiellaceae bacterium]|nr:VWA domain-containing protein [Gaiellaceae bacterium]